MDSRTLEINISTQDYLFDDYSCSFLLKYIINHALKGFQNTPSLNLSIRPPFLSESLYLATQESRPLRMTHNY